MDLITNNAISPAVNQIEVNPFHQQIESQMFLRDNNIAVEAWAPFAEGKNNIFVNDVLMALAKKHNKTVAQIIVRWLVQRNIIVLAKSVRKDRMAENRNIFDFELTTEEMNRISALDTKTSSFFDHRDPKMVKWLGERKLDA